MNIDLSKSDLTSSIEFRSGNNDFTPLNSCELIDIHSSIQSESDCAFLCHRHPQCRTFVFNTFTCRLYEGPIKSGKMISTSSVNSIVGEINYNNINLSSRYNKSCDYCSPDRYLICKNNRCQCPSNTYWNEKNQCINQQYVNSILTCKENNWCREDLNLKCLCQKCQCPWKTFWNNQTCFPQFLQGQTCSNSDQCRHDLQLVCSRTNKTCQRI